MFKTLKEEDIRHYFNELGKPVDNNFVYGYVSPKFLSYFLLGPFTSFAMQFYIIGFSQEKSF